MVYAFSELIRKNFNESVMMGIPLQNYSVPGNVEPVILPRTKWSQLKTCGSFFDELTEYNKAYECSKPVIEESHNITVPKFKIPRCFVVSVESPDVLFVPKFMSNNILLPSPLGKVLPILGFFEEATNTVFLVENFDIEKIYRHELQHYFLSETISDLSGDPEHSSNVWKKCEPPFYDASIHQKISIQLHFNKYKERK